MTTIGIIAIQGDIAEHIKAIMNAAPESNYNVVKIKREGIVSKCDALIIPGGESTTISKLLYQEGIAAEILKNKDMPIMGTCAGLVVLSKYNREGVSSLKLMNITVVRNAFGRQVDSFEMPLDVKGFTAKYPGVFIRAPVIVDAGNDVDVLAKVDDYIVAAQQGNKLALAFHPELTDDVRFHAYFLNMMSDDKNSS